LNHQITNNSKLSTMQIAHFFTAAITATEIFQAFAHAKAYEIEANDLSLDAPIMSPVKCGDVVLHPVQIAARAHELGIYCI
jgi:hypothetical protein